MKAEEAPPAAWLDSARLAIEWAGDACHLDHRRGVAHGRRRLFDDLATDDLQAIGIAPRDQLREGRARRHTTSLARNHEVVDELPVVDVRDADELALVRHELHVALDRREVDAVDR